MTEQEAKTKWCPMARYLAVFSNREGKRESVAAYNRGAEDTGLKNSACIASECCMWRWDKNGGGWIADEDNDGRLRWDNDSTHGGYCGLGGKP